MLTTYEDFIKTAYEGKDTPLPQKTTPSNELLSLLVQTDDINLASDEDQGVVLFMRGGISIAQIINLESAIGLCLSEQKGFRSGLSLYGTVGNVVDMRLLGFIKIKYFK